MTWPESASGPMITMRAGLWQDVLFDLLRLRDLVDDPRVGSLTLIDELIDAIVDSETEVE